MRLVIAGGGTGGHLFPGIAVAEEFLARDSKNEVLFIGSRQGIEARTIPGLGYGLELISAAGVKGKGGFSKLKAAAILMYGYSQSRRILKRFRPDMVMGVGGYASFPVVMAAKGMDIPRFIHEQNALPGLSNRILAAVSERVFISVEESAKFFPEQKTVLTGNPLRRQIIAMLKDVGDGCARDDDGRFRILVFGGSQGAHPLNMALPVAFGVLEGRRDNLAIVHQTGEKDLEDVKALYRQSGLKADVRPFIDDMAAEYRRADLIICRAGATTIAEVTACGKPCLFIPFPHAADDHQRKNAEALLKKGACEMMLEHEMGPERLATVITRLVDDREELGRIAGNAAGLARLDAARMIVDGMLESVGKG